MKIFVLVGFLLFAPVMPARADKFLDSLYRAYHSEKVDSIKYDLLAEIIRQHFNGYGPYYNPDTVAVLLDQTLAELRKKNDQRRLETFWHFKAEACQKTKKYELALQYADSALVIAQKEGDYNEMGSLYQLKGVVCGALELMDRMVQYLYKAIEALRKAGDRQNEANLLFELGNMYRVNQQTDLALQVFLQCAEIKDSLKSTLDAAMSYLFCAQMVMEKGNLKLAEEYIKKGEPVRRSLAVFQPFYYYFTYGKWLKAMKRYEEALNNFSTSIPLAEKAKQFSQKARALSEMGEIYMDLKRFDEAKRLLDEAKTMAYKRNDLETRILVRNALARYYEAIGNPSMALKEFKAWQVLKDSSRQNELARALASSMKEAEYDKRDAERAEAQRKKDVEKAEELSRQKMVAYATGAGLLFVAVIALLLYRHDRQQKRANALIAAEKEHSDDLLLNILPYEVALELKETGRCRSKTYNMVTVMFTDFKDFTRVSEKIGAELLVDEINYCFSAFDRILPKYRVEKIKTIGDSYMCAGGLPVSNDTHAVDLVSASIEIRDFMLAHKKEKESRGEIPFEIRIGIHTGAVVAGIVGLKKFQYDIWGDTVNLAERMQESGEPGKVNISEATFALVKDHFNCTYRGKVQARNKGEIDMYFVENKSQP